MAARPHVWTVAEMRVLDAHWATPTPIPDIAAMLGLTVSQCKEKARSLGLRRPTHGAFKHVVEARRRSRVDAARERRMAERIAADEASLRQTMTEAQIAELYARHGRYQDHEFAPVRRKHAPIGAFEGVAA